MNSLWTGKGAADMVKVQGKGVVSVAHTATGKYTVTFQDVGGRLLELSAVVQQATGVAPMVGTYVTGTFSQSAKTAHLEIWDLATPSLADATDTSQVFLKAIFAKNST